MKCLIFVQMYIWGLGDLVSFIRFSKESMGVEELRAT
jgi:hypothetical protein